jgi:phage protein D
MAKIEQPRKSSLMLIYNGVNATGDFSVVLESFSYTDVASGEADTLSITVNNQTGQWLDGFMPEDGDYIDATIVTENWDTEGDHKTLSCGMFEIDDFKASGYPETAEISGITIPIQTDFNVTAKNRQFTSTTLKTILSDICTGAGISLSYESEDYAIEEIEQSGQTDMVFSFGICKDHNLSMKLYNNKMVVYDQTSYEKQAAAYTVDKSEMQPYSVSIMKSMLYDSVQIQYADPGSDDTLSYSYIIPGGSGKRTLFINEQADTYHDAEVKAKSRLLENIRSATNLTFRVKGDTKHIAARNIQVTGLGKLSGKYFIDRVTHSKNAKGIYTCNIKAHQCITHTDFSAVIPPPKVQAALGTTYTVVKGDNLWNIAKKYYGSGAKYTLIYNANKGIIKSPSLIYPGQVITIPPA